MLLQIDDRENINAVMENREKMRAHLESYYNAEYKLYSGGDIQSADTIGTWRLHDGILYIRNALRILGFEPKPFPEGREHLSAFPWAPRSEAELVPWMNMCCSKVGNRAGVKEISQYLCLYRNLMRVNIDGHVEKILAFLSEKRDPETGYIGLDKDLGWTMRGHRNNILLFTLMEIGLREPLKWQIKIIETTLALQNEDGLFHDGSMCANMDAVHILAEYHLQTGLFADKILSAVRKAISGMLNILQHPEGGFYFDIQQKQNDPENCWLMSGAGFFMESVRYWLVIDLPARTNNWKILDGSKAEFNKRNKVLNKIKNKPKYEMEFFAET